MRIALHDADKKRRGEPYPNLALMKLSAWHKAQGDTVEWFNPLYTSAYDRVYSSKVFSWSPESRYLPQHTIKGGTGYGLLNTLPDYIEAMRPDYSLYGRDFSLGFLTRGCVRSCSWCVVPAKEGRIRAHADIESFLQHQDVKLMDNNVLAHDHGIDQLCKLAWLGVRVDFNQGLDATLIDRAIAKRLAAIRWIRFIRLACDRKEQMPAVAKAVQLLRAAGGSYREYACYVLVKDDLDDALERVEFLRTLNITPFAQPYRIPGSSVEPARPLKHFARWANHKAIYKTVPWSDYSPRLTA